MVQKQKSAVRKPKNAVQDPNIAVQRQKSPVQGPNIAVQKQKNVVQEPNIAVQEPNVAVQEPNSDVQPRPLPWKWSLWADVLQKPEHFWQTGGWTPSMPVHLAPLPLGGVGGRGVATTKRKNELLLRAGFQPARIFFWY